MIDIRNLAVPLSAGDPSTEGSLRSAAARRLGVGEERITSLRLLKRSVDARRKSNVHFVVTLRVSLDDASGTAEADVVRRVGEADVFIAAQASAPAIASVAAAP
ncbi:MAG: FAD-dependent oxidoreductase, partial [Coriobacteriia bacterium]|nr:FAD-dependent oxidoreductase [Coriobacteriia bacterium]